MHHRVGRTKRSRSVTWLALLVFCLAGINAGRVGFILADRNLWAGFDLPFPLPLRAALSATWAGALAVTAWGLWARRRWARRWTLVLFPLYQLYELGWYLAFVRGDYEQGRMPFVLVSTIGVTLVVMWMLTRRSARSEFEGGSNQTEGKR